MLKLKELRESSGINQQQLAFRINVSRSTIAMWETGKATPNLDMLNTIADIFNVSVDYLLGRDSLPISTTTALYLGENLKKLRKQNNLTMKKLGEMIGVSESTISLYESGGREPSLETIKLLANFFSVPVDYLLGNEEKQSGTLENITPDCKILINKYLQLNSIGKDRANEYIDGLLLNKMYTQEDKKEEFVDFDEKVRYIGSDDTIRYAAYGGGVGSDDNTVKHN